MPTDLSTLLTEEIRYHPLVGDKTFAERLGSAIKEAGLSKAKAADIIGVSEQQMGRYLDGTTPKMDFLGMLRLCDRLGADPYYLAFGRERPLIQLTEGSGKTALLALGISLLADLRAPAESPSDPARIERIEARVDLVTEMIAAMAQARAETLAAEAATTKPERKRSAGK